MWCNVQFAWTDYMVETFTIACITGRALLLLSEFINQVFH